jgi:predicted RNA binding protein YcfA (HicA-like mRNA interferase family)
VNGKQIIKALEAQGFKVIRVSGSHHILSNGSTNVTVPVHGSADIKIGTLKSIEKQSGVKLKCAASDMQHGWNPRPREDLPLPFRTSRKPSPKETIAMQPCSTLPRY